MMSVIVSPYNHILYISKYTQGVVDCFTSRWHVIIHIPERTMARLQSNKQTHSCLTPEIGISRRLITLLEADPTLANPTAITAITLNIGVRGEVRMSVSVRVWFLIRGDG